MGQVACFKKKNSKLLSIYIYDDIIFHCLYNYFNNNNKYFYLFIDLIVLYSNFFVRPYLCDYYYYINLNV